MLTGGVPKQDLIPEAAENSMYHPKDTSLMDDCIIYQTLGKTRV